MANNTVFGANSAIHGTEGMVNANTGITTDYHNGGLSAEMKTFYDKTLIELATPNLVHMQFGQKRPIPPHGGKTVEFRKMKPLAKNTKVITEGVTPAGTKMVAVPLTATLNQYGDYIEQTDLIELTAIDNTVIEATKLLADQAGRTLDTVVRDVLQTGTNVNYCSAIVDGEPRTVVSRAGLDSTAKLRVVDVFKAAAQLKAVNAPTIDGKYVAIIHPHVAFDLMQEAGDAWIDIKKYAEPEKILNGELGCIGGVRFVESSEAKINCADEVTPGIKTISVNYFSFNSAFEPQWGDNTGYEIGIDVTPTEDMLGKKMICHNFRTNVDTPFTVMGVCPNENSLYIDVELPNETEVGDIAFCEGGGRLGCATYSTIFLGADAYGIIDINGSGTVEHIVKQRGYGNDPLNQRSSIGWKAFMTAAILADEYILRVESGSSFSGTVTSSN